MWGGPFHWFSISYLTIIVVFIYIYINLLFVYYKLIVKILTNNVFFWLILCCSQSVHDPQKKFSQMCIQVKYERQQLLYFRLNNLNIV
jgi:hypothetical protein